MPQNHRLSSPASPQPANCSPPSVPCCPITGEPARRRIQNIPVKLLRSLWRIGLGIDIERLLAGVPDIGLYESHCGLVFFAPRIPGDEAFYADFYRKVGMHDRLNAHTLSRQEFIHAARHVAAGARILDVGCGLGSFARHIPDAEYRGLDPFAPPDAGPAIIRESLEDHVERCPEAYEVVTAFQVVEHMADPLHFAERMLCALKPGGVLILCAPLHPSPTTAIPNFLLNALPHHLTWWNRTAFQALADALSLETIELGELEASPHEGLIHWMHRLSLCHAGRGSPERYFAHRWAWHLSLALAYASARLVNRFRPLPRGAGSAAVFLAARKAGNAKRSS